jgi:hypothetical protein
MMAALQLRLATAAAIIALTGCAQQAVRTDPRAPVAVSSPAPAPVASTSTHDWPDGVSPQILQLARDRGYRPMVSNGHTIFCRTDIPTGSTLPRRHCVNSVTLRFELLQQQQTRERMDQGNPIVGQPPGN